MVQAGFVTKLDEQVGIVGPGLVGGELIEQIEATQDILKKQGIEVTVAAIANMKGGKPWMLCKKEGMTLSGFKVSKRRSLSCSTSMDACE